MKLVYKNIDKKSIGKCSLICEEAEDMWHAYNLISIDDYLRSSTFRRVINETSVGVTSTSRVHTMLTICVKSLDFDIQAGVLRVKGTNAEENQFVKLGAFHTIDLELNRKFEITKHEWDSVALERIEEACDPSRQCDLAAVVMQEGLAHVCLIRSSMTLVKAKIEMAIPRKRKNMCSAHDKSMDKFFERILQALVQHINFDVVKAIIIASPGFIKDQFFEFMTNYIIKHATTYKLLIDNKSKFILVHSASGFKHSLKEIFDDPNLAVRLIDTKAMSEVKSLDSFYTMLKAEPERAFYGCKHVEMACEAEAIDVLLVTDSLFRSKNLTERKKYVRIVDKVKENNGQVRIFSSLHVSGEQLLQLTGIAAILRFPMPEIDQEELSDSDEEDDRINRNETVRANGHIYTADESTASASGGGVGTPTKQTSPASSTHSLNEATTSKPIDKDTASTSKKIPLPKKVKAFYAKQRYDDDHYDAVDIESSKYDEFDDI